MALEIDEPEILLGSRAWRETQLEFQSLGNPSRTNYRISMSWYDTSLSEYEGAFCMVQAGHEMTELIGEIVQVTWRNQKIWVYCIGSEELTTEFAVTRRAFFALTDLSLTSVRASVRAAV